MKTLLFIYLLVTSLSLTAQNGWKCGTEQTRLPLSGYPKMKKDAYSRSNTSTLYIPVTINILGTDNGSGYYPLNKALNALCQLQNDFAPYGLHFYIEDFPKYFNSSVFYDMNAAYLFSNSMFEFIQTHNTPNTMNVYIVQDAEGYAFAAFRDFDYNNTTYPPTMLNVQNHGIVMSKFYLDNNNHTFTHEVGHFLGLWHTFNGWEGYNYLDYAGATPDTLFYSAYDPVLDTTFMLPWLVERTDVSNCEIAGDLICDTHPDYLSIGFQCNVDKESDLLQTDPNGALFRSDGTLYMSYSNDACQERFSAGQASWMRDVAQGPRAYLLYNQTPPGPFPPTDWTLIYPPDLDTIAVSDSITLEWETAQNADFYLLEFGRKVTNNLYVPILKDILLDKTTFKVMVNTGLNYYWKVSAASKYFPCEVISDTSFFSTKATSGIKEIGPRKSVIVYPNPVVNQLSWYLPETAKCPQYSIQLFNIRGEIVNQIFAPDRQSIEIGNLPAGIYIMRLVNGSTVHEGRFIKR